MISKTIKKILNKEYELTFPTVGQLQDIESMKLALTDGRYSDMAFGGIRTHSFMLDVTDAVAYLSVLVPTLKKDLNIENWRTLDPFVAKKLIKDFRKIKEEWLQPIFNDLYTFDEEDKTEEVKE